jgi:hypothetical protein
MNRERLPITDADSPAADGSIFLITDSRSTDLELPTQSALHGVKLLSSRFWGANPTNQP